MASERKEEESPRHVQFTFKAPTNRRVSVLSGSIRDHLSVSHGTSVAPLFLSSATELSLSTHYTSSSVEPVPSPLTEDTHLLHIPSDKTTNSTLPIPAILHGYKHNIDRKPHKRVPPDKAEDYKCPSPPIRLNLDVPRLMASNANHVTTYTASQRLAMNADVCLPFDEIPFDAILSMMMRESESEEEVLFTERGYRMEYKVCDTLQGELFKGKHMELDDDGSRTTKAIAIKRVSKELTRRGISGEDDQGFTFCVDEDVVKEALILHRLNESSQSESKAACHFVVEFIDFFSSAEHHYLVMEWVDGPNLKQFIRRLHEYTDSGRLSQVQWSRIAKWISWQLTATLHWLHHRHHCVHLDLCLENVMLSRDPFVFEEDGMVRIEEVTIKLVDFGCAEIFDAEQMTESMSFECTKVHLTVDNEVYQSPKVYEGEQHDALKTDCFCLGVVLYSLLSGLRLYTVTDIMQSECEHNGYRALMDNQLPRYLDRVGLSKYFHSDSMAMLSELLCFDETLRADTARIINREYWRPYNRAYCARPSDLLSLGTLIVHCLCNKPLVDIPITIKDDGERKKDENLNRKIKRKQQPKALQNVQIYLLRYNISSRMKFQILKSWLNVSQKRTSSADRAMNAEIQRVLCRRMNRYGQSECVGDGMLKMDCFPFYNCRSDESSDSRSKHRNSGHFWRST